MEEYNNLEKIQKFIKNKKESIKYKYNRRKQAIKKYYENINNIINSMIILSVSIAFITTLFLNVYIAFYFLSSSIFFYAFWLIRLTFYRKN